MTVPSGDLKDRVLAFLRDEAAPALHLDAGAIEVLAVRDGVAEVRLGDACAGCPGSVMGVLKGLEQELHRRVPEVEYLDVVPGTRPGDG
jgi:Fe-S cluster biogenesis protein NfuA